MTATAARTIATVTLTDEERTMLRYAGTQALTPAEKRELLYYLDVETLPHGAAARVEAAVARILGDRLTGLVPARTLGDACLRCHGDLGWYGGHGTWEPCPDCTPA